MSLIENKIVEVLVVDDGYEEVVVVYYHRKISCSCRCCLMMRCQCILHQTRGGGRKKLRNFQKIGIYFLTQQNLFRDVCTDT